MTRRNLVIPDDLYTQIQKAAADEGARQGRPVSVSEWVRGVLREAVK